MRHLRHRKPGRIAAKGDVAGGRHRAAEAVRAALHDGPPPEPAIAQRAIVIEHHVAEKSAACSMPPGVIPRLRTQAGAADGEILARAANTTTSEGLAAPSISTCEFRYHCASETALPRSAIERDAQDLAVLRGQDIVGQRHVLG